MTTLISNARLRTAVIVVCAVAAATTYLATTGYRTPDPDSRLYAAMSEELAVRPFVEWAAPNWAAHKAQRGRFYEHPPAHLWLGACLVSLGTSGLVAVYIVNLLSLALGLIVLWQVGRTLGGEMLAWRAVLIWILTPTFIQYLPRGSQEHPITLGVVLALYALTVPRASPLRVLILATAIDVALMVKGVAGLSVPLIAAGYWLFCSRSRRTAAELVLGLAVAAGVPIGFELWHRALTGESFWLRYLDVQVLESVGAGSALADKAYNFVYYFFRPFWFFFPWMFLFAYGLVDWLKTRDRTYQHTAWLISVVVYAVFTLGFSVADRKAERYILPMYPAMALGVAWLLRREALAVRPVRWLHHELERHQAMLLPSVAGLLVIMLVIRVYISAHHHIDIRLWSGNTDHLH